MSPDELRHALAKADALDRAYERKQQGFPAWTPHDAMDDEERARFRAAYLEENPPTRTELLTASLTPWSDAELEASREPHPQVFSGSYERGLFPVGELTVVGAMRRMGKTTIMVATGTAAVIEHSLAGLWPMKGRSVIIYSAEDDRKQYARKVAAQCSLLSREQADMVKRRIIVPDLDADGMEPLRRLVTMADRRPITTGTDDAIIEAITPMMQAEFPPALVIFETVSTLSDAEEDNASFAVFTAALKRIARRLGVAVALVHHVSQASEATLSDLSVTPSSFRGGTSLPSNSRQNPVVIDLGSDADPFPANDARTVLRELVADGRHPERITALVAMETSKGQDPAPIFFRWVRTDYGPAAVELEPPEHLVGKSWRKVREMVMAERGTRRADAKASTREAAVDTVVRVVKQLAATGKQPTARAVSIAAGKSDTWAKPYLEQAAVDELLKAVEEDVPRVKGKKWVYRPVDDSTEPQA
ncbi:MAG: AAA family ATPase [Luteimonas sp.]